MRRRTDLFLFAFITVFLSLVCLCCTFSRGIAAESTPDTAQLKQQGLAAEADGDWEGALKIYREILVIEPNNADLLMRVAGIEEDSGNDTAAAQDFQKAADIDPNNDKAFFGLSRAYSSLDKPRQAFAAIERAVQLDPKNVQYLQARAEIAAWVADYDTAADSYERLSLLRPEDDSILLNRARVESWRDNLDTSVRLYKTYLERHPDNREAMLELVQVESWRGNYSKALDLLEDYRQKAGVTDDYLKQKARVLAWADRPRAAFAINDPLLKKMPEDYELNYTNSLALHYINRPTDAVNSLAVLQKLRPEAKETDDIRRFVMTPLRSYVEAGFSFYHDTDSLNMYRSYLKGAYKLDYETRLTAEVHGDFLTARRGSGLENINGDKNAWHQSAQIGIIHRFLPEFSADGYVGGASTESHVDLTYGVGADFRFIDALSFRIDRNYGFYVDSPRTLSLGIRRGVNHITAEWRPDVNYTVEMMGGYNDYSDGNVQWETVLAPRRAVLRANHINLDIGLYLERMGFRERKGNGYYDPELYQRYTLQTLWYWKINDDNGVSLVLGYGIQKDETMDGFRETYDAALEGTFGLYRDWMLKVSVGEFHSLRQTGPYNAFTATASLTRRF